MNKMKTLLLVSIFTYTNLTAMEGLQETQPQSWWTLTANIVSNLTSLLSAKAQEQNIHLEEEKTPDLEADDFEIIPTEAESLAADKKRSREIAALVKQKKHLVYLERLARIIQMKEDERLGLLTTLMEAREIIELLEQPQQAKYLATQVQTRRETKPGDKRHKGYKPNPKHLHQPAARR